MSRVERKEYQETKIMRTRSPVRGHGSTQNLIQFDNNLDHLLEDLQNSVSRPDNALGNNATTYREIKAERTGDSSIRSNSLNRMTNLKAANPVTEYSTDDSYSYTSPDGKKSVKTVKKEHYSYKTSGSDVTDGNRMQNNMNQLDSLLDDLQQVKQSSESYRSGGAPGYQEYSKSKVISGKTLVERDVVYPDTPKSSRSRTLERSDRENSVTRDIQYSNEGTYGDIKSLRTVSPSPSRTSTLSKQTKVTNVHTYPMEVLETTTPDINPEILANLDPNLLPAGNTKVTTTIKTYTYEIPGNVYPSPGSVSETEKFVFSPNDSQSTPSKSFVYNKYENNSLSRNVNVQSEPGWKNTLYRETTTTNVNDQPYQKPSPPVGSDSTLVKETVTTRNYQPGNLYRDSSGQHTYMYDENTTTRSVDGYPPHREPPGKETVIIKETHTTNTNTNTGPPYRSYPPQETVIYKENTTTNNYLHRPHPRDDADMRYPRPPPEPVNITYKYSSTSSTSNNYKGYPPGSETEPLLHPRPFPRDDNDLPPKKLDELMATIGREPPNSPLNAGFNAHEVELANQKKADTLKLQQKEVDEKKVEEIQRTKNVTGPPVYYPPGYEMFAKKEESGGWRAEGAMAKESGKYKAESKSKTKSGATLVPVCLPLCCGLPCTIL